MCKLDGTTVQVQMQDKINYCPAPLGRGATPYTVQYIEVPNLHRHKVYRVAGDGKEVKKDRKEVKMILTTTDQSLFSQF